MVMNLKSKKFIVVAKAGLYRNSIQGARDTLTDILINDPSTVQQKGLHNVFKGMGRQHMKH